MAMDCWKILEIDETLDEREIKRAYTRLIKKNNPEDNPEGFQTLRDAFEQAKKIAKWKNDCEERDSFEPANSHHLDRQPLYDESPELAPIKIPEPIAISPQEEARGVVKEIESILLRSEKAAILELKSILNTEIAEALDFRYFLEGEMLCMLAAKTSLYEGFMRFAAKEFSWPNEISASNINVDTPFGKDAEYSHAWRVIGEKVRIAELRLDLINKIRIRTNISKDVDKLLLALFGEFNRDLLSELSENEYSLRDLLFVMNYIYTREDAYVVSEEIMEWLKQNLGERYRSVYIKPAVNTKKSGNVSGNGIWVVFFLLFLVAKFAMLVTNDDSNKYSPPKPSPAHTQTLVPPPKMSLNPPKKSENNYGNELPKPGSYSGDISEEDEIEKVVFTTQADREITVLKVVSTANRNSLPLYFQDLHSKNMDYQKVLLQKDNDDFELIGYVQNGKTIYADRFVRFKPSTMTSVVDSKGNTYYGNLVGGIRQGNIRVVTRDGRVSYENFSDDVSTKDTHIIRLDNSSL